MTKVYVNADNFDRVQKGEVAVGSIIKVADSTKTVMVAENMVHSLLWPDVLIRAKAAEQ